MEKPIENVTKNKHEESYEEHLIRKETEDRLETVAKYETMNTNAEKLMELIIYIENRCIPEFQDYTHLADRISEENTEQEITSFKTKTMHLLETVESAIEKVDILPECKQRNSTEMGRFHALRHKLEFIKKRLSFAPDARYTKDFSDAKYKNMPVVEADQYFNTWETTRDSMRELQSTLDNMTMALEYLGYEKY